MVCDNDQSSSDASSVLEAGLEEEHDDSQPSIGTGVSYVNPTIVSPEIPTSKNKFKKNPSVSEVEPIHNLNSSEFIGNANMDSTKTISSSTTESTTTVSVDTTTKFFMKNSTSVSNITCLNNYWFIQVL